MYHKYKIIEDNILILIGNSTKLPDGAIEVTESEYLQITGIISNKPEDTETTIYKLRADTLEYVGYDRPEEPVIEPTDPVIDSIISEVASNGYQTGLNKPSYRGQSDT